MVQKNALTRDHEPSGGVGAVPVEPQAARIRPAEVVELYPGAAARRPVRQPRNSDETRPHAASRRSPSTREPTRLRVILGTAGRGLPRGEAAPRRGTPRDEELQRPGTRGSEAGMATAEYAIATLAAVAFAGLLVVIMRSDEVRGFLLNIIRAALAIP